MKRILCYFCMICIFALLSGCTPDSSGSGSSGNATTTVETTLSTETTTVETTTTMTWATVTQPTNSKGLPEYVPGSIKLEPNNAEAQGGWVRPYRLIYYGITDPYYKLVDEKAFYDWADNIYNKNNPYHKEKEMQLAAFVKYFKITREQFDEAITKAVTMNEDMGIDMANEQYEIPNADIIYTFDNAIINEFYRYA